MTSDGLTNLDRTFTRAGAFKLNENSYMVNNQGNYLQGYEINSDGTLRQSASMPPSLFRFRIGQVNPR